MAKFATLYDNFNDNSFDTAKWSKYLNGATITETGGQLKIAIATGVDKDGSIYPKDWATTYDLTGSYIAVEVVTPLGNTGEDASTQLQAIYDGDNSVYLEFHKGDGKLYARKIISGVLSTIAEIAWNGTNMRWWRIREAGGTTYFDYSANGNAWTNLASLANPFVETALFCQVYCYGSGLGATRSAYFDNFNVLPPVSSNFFALFN